uniref:Uncharacterized protein n=1 Tax=Shewanella decolorationis TaxID=256839 RepID=A0A5B8QUM6_9GAMM
MIMKLLDLDTRQINSCIPLGNCITGNSAYLRYLYQSLQVSDTLGLIRWIKHISIRKVGVFFVNNEQWNFTYLSQILTAICS